MCVGIEDIHPSCFRLRFPFVKAFTTSPWFPPVIFIFYRLVIGLYCLAWLIFTTSQTTPGQWMLFISHWVFLFIAIYFIAASILSILYSYSDEARYHNQMKSTRWGAEPYIEGFSGEDRYQDGSNHPQDELNVLHKALWVVFTIASVGAVQISLIYWIVLYQNAGIDSVSITFLIFNSVFITIELLISNIPVILLHFFYSHLFQSIYILFTFIYWAAGGGPAASHNSIFNAFDYGKEPGWACLFVFMYLVIFQMLSHLYCLALCSFRKWLVRKCYYP